MSPTPTARARVTRPGSAKRAKTALTSREPSIGRESASSKEQLFLVPEELVQEGRVKAP